MFGSTLITMTFDCEFSAVPLQDRFESVDGRRETRHRRYRVVYEAHRQSKVNAIEMREKNRV